MGERYDILKINPYEDFRGELKKIFKKSMLVSDKTVGEIYVLYTIKDCVRGNHYHKHSIEFFTVIRGKAAIALKDLETGDSIVLTVSEEDNIVIKVPEKVAHVFRNDGKEDLIILAVATEEYDPGNTDTYSYKLL